MSSNNFVWFATLTLAFSLSSSAQAQPDSDTTLFIADVLCGTEFSGVSEKFCVRWNKSPSLSTFGQGNLHPVVVANVINQLNACLPESRQVRKVGDNDSKADIQLFFAPLRKFPEIAEEHGFELVEGNWGFFDIRWNDDYEIEKSIVMIADDRLTGSRLHHFVLEEVTQSLGLAGDSKRKPDSVFFEDASKRKYGKVVRLSRLDRKLIKFHYQHVKPGSHPVELGVQLAKHWN